MSVALIGCGGRGSGAVLNALSADKGPIRIPAMGDVYEDKLKGCYDALKRGSMASKVEVGDDKKFIGFDGYKQAMDCLKPGDIAVFATPLIYLAHDVASVEHRKLFTWQMRFGGGLAIVPIAVAVLIGLVRADRPERDEPMASHLPACRNALWASLLLFGAGGAVGFLIQGSDVRIPAHYHGSIVGITNGLM